MNQKIKTALVSVFAKEGLDEIVQKLDDLDVQIFSTGGTYDYITNLGIKCTQVEQITTYPSILGGRVKTLHPTIFGGILARRENEHDQQDVKEYNIPLFDLVMVDLYPFQETVRETKDASKIIEKIDIGGVSLIRAAAKNYQHCTIISHRGQYPSFLSILNEYGTEISEDLRKSLATEAFGICADYDIAIYDWFSRDQESPDFKFSSHKNSKSLRYGENPHQEGVFWGELDEIFSQKNGKDLSYNNLVDLDAALDLITDFPEKSTFAVLKHTNVCGLATRASTLEAWKDALAGDPESAFGGVLICNSKIDLATAEEMNKIFFEVIVAPGFDDDALALLKSKKNRIILEYKKLPKKTLQTKNILNGSINQSVDDSLDSSWEEKGATESTPSQKEDLNFANKVVKHLKSNAISLVKDKQLLGKGAGQTSRIDALRQALEKAKQFDFALQDAVMASDAFFPFDDCVRIAHKEGISAVIEPGGSIRDQDTIDFCKENNMVLVMSGQRHFKH